MRKTFYFILFFSFFLEKRRTRFDLAVLLNLHEYLYLGEFLSIIQNSRCDHFFLKFDRSFRNFESLPSQQKPILALCNWENLTWSLWTSKGNSCEIQEVSGSVFVVVLLLRNSTHFPPTLLSLLGYGFV